MLNKFGVTSLGSGSKGNATIVRFADTWLLIDNGYSCKELESRMLARNIEPAWISAILVTHEHSDHFNGVPAFGNKYKIPVWMSNGTSLHPKAAKVKTLHRFNNHQCFNIEDILVSPVAVPHDSREASQFIFQVQQQKIGILTDIGHITPFVIEQYQDCDILLLEFNHDRERLLNSAYPASLKSRVAGNLGHLSNQQAGEFLTDKIIRNLKYLVAMHLSEENNRPEIVLETIKSSQLSAETEVIIAEQNSGFDWMELMPQSLSDKVS